MYLIFAISNRCELNDFGIVFTNGHGVNFQ